MNLDRQVAFQMPAESRSLDLEMAFHAHFERVGHQRKSGVRTPGTLGAGSRNEIGYGTGYPPGRGQWAAGGALAALLTLPGSRAVAQRMWDSVFLKRVEVIPVNLDDLPEDAKSLRAEIVQRPGEAQPARDSGEAVKVPAEWAGARIGAEFGPILMAEWPDVMLMQTPPITLVTPADFDLARLVE
jgi:hypothetical protein